MAWPCWRVHADIFVFLDTWDQMKLNMRGQGVQARMSATLRHAGKAMATTSFSTIFAFLANATSSFPAVCVAPATACSRSC